LIQKYCKNKQHWRQKEENGLDGERGRSVEDETTGSKSHSRGSLLFLMRKEKKTKLKPFELAQNKHGQI